MILRIKSIVICSLLSLLGYAQCPNSDTYWNKLQQIYKLPFEKQLSAYLELKNIAQKCNITNDSTYANVVFGLSGVYYYSSNFDDAIKNAELAINITLKYPQKANQNNLPKFYFYLGLYHYSKNEYQEAINSFDKTQYYFKKNQSYGEYYISSYQYLSSIHFNLGDYEKSISSANEGLRNINLLTVYQENYRFRLMYEKAKAYYELKKMDLALEAIENGIINIKKYKNEVDLAYSLFLKGNILSLSKIKFNEAEKTFFQSINIFKQLKDTLNLAVVYTNLGDFYLKVNKFDKSIEYSTYAFKFTNRDEGKIRVLNNIGVAYKLKKDYPTALKNFQKAFVYFPFGSEKIYIAKNNNTQKIKNIQYKEFLFSLLQDKALCWLDFAKSESNKKEYLQNALKTYELTDKLIDYMRQEHTGTQSKYFWRNKTRSIYESAIETCFLLKDYQKAFYFFEKSRAVMLNDKINELGAKQTLSENDQQQERKYIKDISELNANIEKEENQKKKSDLTTQLYTLQEQQDRFIKTLETKNPAYFQLKYDTTIFQLKDIQSYLKKTQINSLVEYFMGDSTTYAIVITPENVALKKLSLKPDNIQQFLEYCSKNISTKTELSALLGYGSNLYQSLIAPLNLPNGRLIISQDGAFIPFEAISKSANSPQYLLKDYAISYTYSAQFLMKNQEKYGFLPNKNFLGAAPINFSSKLNTLQGSEQSLKNIEKNYTFGNLLINQAASRNAFLNEAGKYKIVQLYTHAFADSNDTEPKIYFADSALKVSDLNLTDRFKTNLLILSACKTGVGKVAKGEGVLSLARGFSMAGIRSTITSLWSVEDKDTYKLTELFHHYLNEGLPKDEALRQAKLEFIEHNENVNPYSWAGFILIGDSSEISTSNWIIWALAVFLITSLTLIFAKKLFSKK